MYFFCFKKLSNNKIRYDSSADTGNNKHTKRKQKHQNHSKNKTESKLYIQKTHKQYIKTDPTIEVMKFKNIYIVKLFVNMHCFTVFMGIYNKILVPVMSVCVCIFTGCT